MNPTYRALAEFAQTWGLVYFVGGLPGRARLRAVAVAPGAVRRGRPHAAAGGLIMADADSPTSMRSPARPRPATNGTASASSTRRCRAGGCGCSTSHRLGGRLLDRLSGLAAGLLATRPARSAGSRASAVVRRLDELKALRGADDRPSSPRRSLGEIEADPALARLRPRAGPRRRSRDNCAPCHGAGGGGAKGYPNLNDDDWLWGGKLERDRRRRSSYGIRSGHAEDAREPDAGVRPRRHAEARRDRRRRGLRALARRAADARPTPTSRPARRSSPTIARSATATTARATASSARRT